MNKISFIVIGKNQEKTICDCIRSIVQTVENLKLNSYEIIYVDSNSRDKTIELIQKNYSHGVSIFRLYDYMNAAVGRNLGASKAKGEVLFFIDGDMEINPAFLEKVYSEREGLKYDFVSGKLKEYLYNKQWVKVGVREDRYNITKETYESTVGGVFLIKAQLFRSVQGFSNELRINEDLDFALKLSREKIFLLRIPEVIALHHTMEFYNFWRIVERLRRGDQFYSGLLFRRHIFNIHFMKGFFQREKFTLLLIFSIGFSFFISPLFILLYPLAIFAKYIKDPLNSYLEILLGRVVDNILFIIGILFFYRRQIDTSEIKYEKEEERDTLWN